MLNNIYKRFRTIANVEALRGRCKCLLVASKFYVASLCIGSVLLAACSSNSADSRLSIAVSIPPQASLLKEIAGDSVDVVTLLRPDSNPETFEISVNDMRAIHNCDAYFLIGNLPFEGALVDKIKQTAYDVEFVDNSQGIEPIYGTHDHCHHSHGEVGGHSHHNVADPHTWSSVGNLKIVAANMLNALEALSPQHADYFRANYKQLSHRLDSLDDAFAERLAPLSGKAFLIWHPSLSYFARDYQLQQIAVGQENKDMSVRQFQSQIDQAECNDVAICFVQKNFDSSQAENIIRQLNAKVVEINPLDSDWQRQLEIVVDALAGE